MIYFHSVKIFNNLATAERIKYAYRAGLPGAHGDKCPAWYGLGCGC